MPTISTRRKVRTSTSLRPRTKPGRPRDPALASRRRDEILKIATGLFAKRGYVGADLQDVADALGVGKGTIYRYFPSKRVLFQAAVDRIMLDMRAAIDESMTRATDPLDQLSLGIRSYLQFFHEHPAYVELLILERAEFRDRKTPTYFAYREANRGRWNEFYRGLIRDGRVRQLPPEHIVDVIGDLIYGTMFTNYVAGRTRSLVEQAEDLVNLLFHGLLTPAESVRRTIGRREKLS